MIKTIVFDFDGTIADTIPIKFGAVKTLAREKLGIDVSDKDLLEARDKGFKELLKDNKISIFKMPYIIRRVDAISKEKLKGAKLCAGMIPVIRRLSKECQIGMLTSSKEAMVHMVLKKQHADLFDFIFSGSSFFGKHRTMRRMIRKHRLKKQEIIYVGDEVRDIVACKKMGIRVIAVTWGYNSRKRLLKEKPDYIADKADDIRKIVESIE